MRRAIAAGAATFVGLVLLLSFKTHSRPATPGPPPAAIAGPSPTTAPPNGAATVPPAGASGTANARPTAPSATTSTVTGDPVQTRYGPVEVQLSVSGGRITAAQAVVYPTAKARDREISARAVPRLDQETLSAQSARIDMVSGATYTSAGYIRSLQSALDKAGLG